MTVSHPSHHWHMPRETNVDPNKKTTSTAADFAEREVALEERENKLRVAEEAAIKQKALERRTAIIGFCRWSGEIRSPAATPEIPLWKCW
jgi:hypothetical protein